nr:MAG TPA: hypothetical protein [Caudoviricetes sp.]
MLDRTSVLSRLLTEKHKKNTTANVSRETLAHVKVKRFIKSQHNFFTFGNSRLR